MARRNYMAEIKRSRIARGTAGLWWTGQNGWILKSPGGVTLAVDSYFTDSCTRLYPDAPIVVKRQVPIFIRPNQLDVDVFMCTHSHADHADPETIAGLSKRMKESALFVGPAQVIPMYQNNGIDPGLTHGIFPMFEWEFEDVHVLGTFAMPTDDTDLNHMGFLFTIGGKVRIYITGDTAYTPLLGYMRKYKIDCMCTCINGGFNNLSPWDAARNTVAVNPKIVVPCHYDMMPGNAISPDVFEHALQLEQARSRFTRLTHMKKTIIEK